MTTMMFCLPTLLTKLRSIQESRKKKKEVRFSWLPKLNSCRCLTEISLLMQQRQYSIMGRKNERKKESRISTSNMLTYIKNLCHLSWDCQYSRQATKVWKKELQKEGTFLTFLLNTKFTRMKFPWIFNDASNDYDWEWKWLERLKSRFLARQEEFRVKTFTFYLLSFSCLLK